MGGLEQGRGFGAGEEGFGGLWKGRRVLGGWGKGGGGGGEVVVVGIGWG